MAALTRIGSDCSEYLLFPAWLTDFTLNTYSLWVLSPWTVNLSRRDKERHIFVNAVYYILFQCSISYKAT